MSKKAILSGTALIVFCLSVSQILLSFASYSSARTFTASGTIKPVEPTRLFHGITIDASKLAWGTFTQEDYDRFKRWGVNSVYINVNWGATEKDYQGCGIEPDEMRPGYYSEFNLARIEEQINLIRANGMFPFIGIQNSKFQQSPPPNYVGWPDPLGGDYINLNQPDASGSLGRDRYIAMLKFLVRRFPGVGIDPWRFPYHAQGSPLSASDPDAAQRISTFYNVTQPALLEAIRSIDGAVPVVLNPLLQGVWEGRITGALADQPYYDDPNIWYGIDSHDGAARYGYVCRLGEDWDYDLNKLNNQWQPAVDFLSRYPHAKLICIEWLGLAQIIALIKQVT